jgi:high-affinity nickel permease
MALELSSLAILGLGFALGLKHATDADHVVAVTTWSANKKTCGRVYGSVCSGDSDILFPL